MSAESYLRLLVVTRCKELGDEKAAEFFGVSTSLIRQWVNGSKPPSLAAVEKVFVYPEGKPQEAAWEGKEVFLAAPMYRSTNARTMFSVLALWDRPKYGYRHRFGDAFIIHTRNQLADDYLRSNMPICQWIDDDMIPPVGIASWYLENTKIPAPVEFAGRHGINHLRSRGKSLVGGLYYGRWEHSRAMYAEAHIDDNEDRRSRTFVDECKPTDWVGTGFLQHGRDVLLDIQKTHPHLEPQHPSESWHYFSPTADAIVGRFREMQQKADAVAGQIRANSVDAAMKTVNDLIAQMRDSYEDYIKNNRLQQGEDQLFCRRAKKAGHQPHVDLGVVCGHLDGNVVFGPHNTGKY